MTPPLQPKSTSDLLDLMNGSVYAAALGLAMQLGLFWRLAQKPQSSVELAQSLDIPLNRCHYWLQVLCRLGLLQQEGEKFSPSGLARHAILDALDPESWAFQAREDRDLAMYACDLPANIHLPISEWRSAGLSPAEYQQQLAHDPAYAAQFTRKLYHIHLALADQLAGLLDLQGVTRLLDLGGGSGVVSLALLRKYPGLSSLVIDVDPVCQAGRAIAAENGLDRRITYLPGDIMADDLPSGFDLALLCDVGVYSPDLFRKIHTALNPSGRLVIVDKFAPSPDSAPPSRLLAAFVASLQSPSPSLDYVTADLVQSRLQQAGYRDITIIRVPPRDDLPWNLDWTLLEAAK